MVLPKVDDTRGAAAAVKRGRVLTKLQDAAGVIEANVAALRGLDLSKLPYMDEMVPYRARRHPESLSTLARCTAYTIRKKTLELEAQASLAHDHTFPGSPSASPRRYSRKRPSHLHSLVRPSPPSALSTPEPLSVPCASNTAEAKRTSFQVTYRATPRPPQSQTPSPLKPVMSPAHETRCAQQNRSCQMSKPNRKRSHSMPTIARRRHGRSSDGPFAVACCHPTHIVTQFHGHLSDYNIEGLMADTGFSRAELYTMWCRFKALCSLSKSPKGVDLDTFRRGVPLLSIEDTLFVDRVFSILDDDKSGIIEWPEFIRAMSALEKGDVRDRIRFLFQVYDLNCDGTIGRDELMTFFISSLMVNTPNDDLHEVTKQFVEEILLKLHPTGSGVVSSIDVINYIDHAPQDDIFTLFGRTMLTETDRRRAQEQHMTGAALDDDGDDDLV
ncbi:hypothetical protein H310_06714 [Aphanomyces invadans]|uniref:EF-hand domain-containing protein n=1 Tax=Aphanomyces invadans TaxID=157072 RepID=A0A024U5B9_9STRA|nr:hypothetical protein H310_06714 [Aphanomyces invadans]ETW01097.1 hypothetical protein H310_06714 [Aphanomyces invadans]|eukprot:XP_008870095.1 hypothetical protein H310_06714 [Aphanomyces invadans]